MSSTTTDKPEWLKLTEDQKSRGRELINLYTDHGMSRIQREGRQSDNKIMWAMAAELKERSEELARQLAALKKGGNIDSGYEPGERQQLLDRIDELSEKLASLEKKSNLTSEIVSQVTSKPKQAPSPKKQGEGDTKQYGVGEVTREEFNSLTMSVANLVHRFETWLDQPKAEPQSEVDKPKTIALVEHEDSKHPEQEDDVKWFGSREMFIHLGGTTHKDSKVSTLTGKMLTFKTFRMLTPDRFMTEFGILANLHRKNNKQDWLGIRQ